MGNGNAVELLARGLHRDAFAVLGAHLEGEGAAARLVVRAFQPGAAEVAVVPRLPSRQAAGAGAGTPMRRIHPAGVFEASFDRAEAFPYRLRVTGAGGEVRDLDDAYAFGRVMGELDLHLLGEGRHERAFDVLGAHLRTIDEVAGVYFAVWAPNADRVSVVGNFNAWDGRVHVMRQLVPSGFWEIFVPGLGAGERYKFEIRSKLGGLTFLKSDPWARYAEKVPATASIVWDASGYAWRDEDWMRQRPAQGSWFERPMAIYEAHLGSWARVAAEANRQLTYRELAERLVPYVRDLGYTHIELMPVMEHPYDGSWGYQAIGWFAPTSRFGPPEDFKWFVDECHLHGIGVILDWVPGHFPKDAHGLARFDGTALYEHADPRQGEHMDWGTLIFNYGRNEVRNFLQASALFWLGEFHLDGLRVDAVASMLYLDYSRKAGEWVPNRHGGRENLEAIDFLRQMNELTHGRCPGTVTIAEESTSWPAVSRPVYLGGLGFTYKWNMGWMHDMLEYMKQDPVFRRWAHNKVTFSMLYAYNENFILPFSHDEVVHLKRSMLDKMPGDVWRKAANLRALYGYMYGHPGKKLLFQGQEFGQWTEWSENEGLPWDGAATMPHLGIQRFVRDLNALYRREPPLHELDFEPGGFAWIDCNDNENSVFSFVRRSRAAADLIVVVVNYTPVAREGYRIGVPQPGTYAEVLNSDAAAYGGSNVGNAGAVVTEAVPSHGHGQSLRLVLPPLGCLFLKWQDAEAS
jgi:1,4-alpha-glucan branching enzyme